MLYTRLYKRRKYIWRYSSLHIHVSDTWSPKFYWLNKSSKILKILIEMCLKSSSNRITWVSPYLLPYFGIYGLIFTKKCPKLTIFGWESSKKPNFKYSELLYKQSKQPLLWFSYLTVLYTNWKTPKVGYWGSFRISLLPFM